MPEPLNPTERFTARVENYVKYRPSYPDKIIDYLSDKAGLNLHSRIADIGSGTGLLTEVFLRNGNRVFGVEPNQSMRIAGERYLSEYSNFTSVDGSAEATTLAESSFELVVAGQAFHWFKPIETKREFKRILKAEGFVALIWNRRSLESDFLQAYEKLLLTNAPTYQNILGSHMDEDVIRKFFEPNRFKETAIAHAQYMNFDALRGRLESASYCPSQLESNYQPLMQSLQKLFDTYAENERVSFKYDTVIFSGKIF